MKKTISDFATHKTNPFLTDALPYIKEKKALTKFVPQDGTFLLNQAGDVSPALAVHHVMKHVDTQQYTKVFGGFMREKYGLNKSGLKVLELYFWQKIKKDSDLVDFSLIDCKKICGFKTAQSVYDGLAQLLEKEFIARTEQHHRYYINPMMFFNGNRIILVKEIIKEPKFKELPKGE